MKIVFSFLISLLLYADYGVDTLALPKYVHVVKENLPHGWWFSSFAETFGDGISAIDQVNYSGRPKGFRVQLLWSDSHTYGDDDISKIIELSKRVESVARRHPRIKCEISPFCEHNLNNPDKYLEIVKKHAPSCTPVNTVWKGKLSTRYKNEVHGVRAAIPQGRFNWSYDGDDPKPEDFITIKNQYREAEVFYLWNHRLNNKRGATDRTPAKEREYLMSVEEFHELVNLATGVNKNTDAPGSSFGISEEAPMG